MAGRGRGRSTGGGRGTGRGRYKKNSSTKKKTKLSDHIYYIGSDLNGSGTFARTTQCLLNYMQRTYNNGEDIATAIEQRRHLDFTQMPRRQRSSHDKESPMYASENERYQADHLKEIDSFVKRRENYRSNKCRAYAEIWFHCSDSLQNKIESMEEFASKIESDPIELIKVIEELSISDDLEYDVAHTVDAMRNLVNIEQKCNEELADYNRRFLDKHDLVVALLHKLLKNEDGTVEANDSQRQKDIWDRLMAYLYIDGALKKGHGSLMSTLEENYMLLNSNNYPATLDEAVSLLARWN